MVTILLPKNTEAGSHPGTTTLRYADSAHLAVLIAGLPASSPVVLYHDGLTDREQARITGTLGAQSLDVIEVRGPGWDGFESTPLSSACRAVISGFGTAGIAQAVSALSQPA